MSKFHESFCVIERFLNWAYGCVSVFFYEWLIFRLILPFKPSFWTCESLSFLQKLFILTLILAIGTLIILSIKILAKRWYLVTTVPTLLVFLPFTLIMILFNYKHLEECYRVRCVNEVHES